MPSLPPYFYNEYISPAHLEKCIHTALCCTKMVSAGFFPHYLDIVMFDMNTSFYTRNLL